jgi:hypothetical protein
MAANGGGNFTARTRFRGSKTLLPSAMAALAIDTTKALNTKTVAAASVFTFAGTPRAGERFSLALKNSTGSSVTITLPTVFSVNTQALVNRFTLAANGRELLSFQFDAADGYCWIFGEPAGATLVGVAPTLVSAQILTVSGAEVLDLTFTEAVAIGAGGLGVALTASGGALTPTYASGTGTATLRCSLSRRVTNAETITASHTQAGNGIEASDDLTDVANFSGQAVTNSSAYAGGGGPAFIYANAITSNPAALSSSNIIDTHYAGLSKIVFASAGTVTKLGIWLEYVNASTAIQMALFDAARNPVGSAVSANIASGNSQWHDIVSSIAVPSAGTYFIGFSADGPYTGSLVGKQATGAALDLYQTYAGGSYGDFPGSLNDLETQAYPWAVRAELTP